MTALRNLSLREMFIRIAEHHEPICQSANHQKDFANWKEAAKSRILETISLSLEAFPLNPEPLLEWTNRGVLNQRYGVDVGPHISAALQINRLSNPPSDRESSALQSRHGQGSFGKDPATGRRGDPEVRDTIDAANHDYGHQMADKGFITHAIDWSGEDERNGQLKPIFPATAAVRAWRNLYYPHTTKFGLLPLSINLAHEKVTTDFVCSLPEVALIASIAVYRASGN